MTRVPSRRRSGEASPRAEKFGGFITGDHKVLNEDGESPARCRCSRSCHSMDSNPIRAKQRLHRRRAWVYESYSSRDQSQKLFILELLKILWRSIMESSNFDTYIDPRQVASLKEPYEEWKKVLQQYCYDQDLDEKWWADSTECYLLSATCPRPPGRWENSQWKTIRRIFANNPCWSNGWTSSDFSSRSFKTGYELSAGGIWKGGILIADLDDLEKLDASEIYPRRINAEEVLIPQKGDEFIFPVADDTAKLPGRDYDFREPRSKREQTVRSEDLSGRTSRWTGKVSTDRIDRWSWSPWRLLVDPRWLHLSSSQWTSSSTLCAERRNIPYSTEIHWCNKVSTLYWKKHLPKNICGPGGDWQKFKLLPEQTTCGQKYGRKLVKPLRTEKKQEWKKREAKTRQCSKTERDLLCSCWWPRLQRNSQQCEEKIGKTYGSEPCRARGELKQAPRRWPRCRKLASQKNTKPIYGCKVESHE